MSFYSEFSRRFVSFNTYLILVTVCLCLLVVYKININSKSTYYNKIGAIFYPDLENARLDFDDYHDDIVNYYYEKRKEWTTSKLGSILYKNNNKIVSNANNRTFVILIWKYYKWLENRHVYSFNSKEKGDPLGHCSVKNCIFTGEDKHLSKANAVVVHIQKGAFPNAANRNQKQRWVFLSDESPVNAFTMAKKAPKLSDIANIFNWSMTYRSDSDVPVPYGRTIPLKEPLAERITYAVLISLVPDWDSKQRDVLATILMSHCGISQRDNYLNELKKHMKVDVYGKCSEDHKDSCPGHFRSDCKLMSNYLFYLVFENSICEEYLTEKLFYHAYSKGAIPVIMGSSVDSCKKLLPPDSFLHIDDYKSPKDLAQHMSDISKDNNSILSYHRWRNDFQIANEHGYFGSKSYHFCRICEALNYNDVEEKIYSEDKLRAFLDPRLSCH